MSDKVGLIHARNEAPSHASCLLSDGISFDLCFGLGDYSRALRLTKGYLVHGKAQHDEPAVSSDGHENRGNFGISQECTRPDIANLTDDRQRRSVSYIRVAAVEKQEEDNQKKALGDVHACTVLQRNATGRSYQMSKG